MVITKQNMKRARYPLPDAYHRTVQETLARLKPADAGRSLPNGRRIAAAACAAALVVCVAAAGIPVVRTRLAGLAGNAFALLAGPQKDIATLPGVAAQGTATAALTATETAASPAPAVTITPNPDSAFMKYLDDHHPVYSTISGLAVKVNASQTVNGITATIQEAAIAGNKLWLAMRFENVPEHCFPAEEILAVTLDGKEMRIGGSATESGDGFAFSNKIDYPQEQLPQSFPVAVAFELRQFADDGTGKGDKLADFNLNFEMDRPAALVTLEEEKTQRERRRQCHRSHRRASAGREPCGGW